VDLVARKGKDAQAGRGKWSEQWIELREKGRTHTLEDENGVSSGFNCKKREGRTCWETKME